jgi:hypothetical protein
VILSYTSVQGRLVMADLGHLTLDQERFLMADACPRDRANVARTVAQMTIRERRWMARATGAQQAIGWGSWAWFRFERSSEASLPSCTIYGEIYTADELERRERSAAGLLAGTGERFQDPSVTIAACHESHALGWRYGRWYSVAEPGGEPGENHIAQLTQITRSQFEAARAAGWPEVPPWV